jgi:hypothetical protein
MTKFIILAVAAVACVSAGYQSSAYGAPVRTHYQAPAPVYYPTPAKQYYNSELILLIILRIQCYLISNHWGSIKKDMMFFLNHDYVKFRFSK